MSTASVEVAQEADLVLNVISFEKVNGSLEAGCCGTTGEGEGACIGCCVEDRVSLLPGPASGLSFGWVVYALVVGAGTALIAGMAGAAGRSLGVLCPADGSSTTGTGALSPPLASLGTKSFGVRAFAESTRTGCGFLGMVGDWGD